MRYFVLALLLAGCGCDSSQWGYECSAFGHYTVSSTQTTPGGVHYDGALDPTTLDTYTDAVEACLGRPVPRDSFIVKLAPDWYESPAACVLPDWGPQQLLPVAAPSEGCEAKGFTPTAECPCQWRGGIRCPGEDSEGRYVLVETPNLLLLKDNLIRLTAGTSDPWSAEYATCATP